MTLNEFNQQVLSRRTDEILEWGFYMDKRSSYDLTTVLFSVHQFFAVMNIRISDNKILNIKGLGREDILKDETFFISPDHPLVTSKSCEARSLVMAA